MSTATFWVGWGLGTLIGFLALRWRERGPHDALVWDPVRQTMTTLGEIREDT